MRNEMNVLRTSQSDESVWPNSGIFLCAQCGYELFISIFHSVHDKSALRWQNILNLHAFHDMRYWPNFPEQIETSGCSSFKKWDVEFFLNPMQCQREHDLIIQESHYQLLYSIILSAELHNSNHVAPYWWNGLIFIYRALYIIMELRNWFTELHYLIMELHNLITKFCNYGVVFPLALHIVL